MLRRLFRRLRAWWTARRRYRAYIRRMNLMFIELYKATDAYGSTRVSTSWLLDQAEEAWRVEKGEL